MPTSVQVFVQQKITPAVTVTPGASTLSIAQMLAVTVTVSGGSGNAAPTGTVILSGGGYTSPATALSAGSATIDIPAGALSLGTDTLTAAYTPDSDSAPVYNGASGSAPVILTPVLITPTVTVTPGASSITTAQSDSVTVTVSGGNGNPTPTGSVTLSSGSYTSSPTTLSAGSANINVPAGQLGVGSDTTDCNLCAGFGQLLDLHRCDGHESRDGDAGDRNLHDFEPKPESESAVVCCCGRLQRRLPE